MVEKNGITVFYWTGSDGRDRESRSLSSRAVSAVEVVLRKEIEEAKNEVLKLKEELDKELVDML